MISNPHVVFDTDPKRGLLARSGWEQVEARAVLRDLGWEWQEELHALVPPTDTPDVDAGVQAVEQLHMHGYRTGFSVGPFGAIRLTTARAEQVFTRATATEPAHPTEPDTTKTRYAAYGGPSNLDSVSPQALTAPPL
ncbi:hypothetical protein [Kitasatospora sp. NPDC058218]|uniref:hypothetical protein n=1 Tax=Kitasatospora sp. NPDC058218 TaxID=3346385 RepID=UPI0036DC1700